ncbi:MAG: hypothetical protein SF123_11400 [Chloroflexota bacterium]|nr:hypothetical protein [Chloroflexota bacterium]
MDIHERSRLLILALQSGLISRRTFLRAVSLLMTSGVSVALENNLVSAALPALSKNLLLQPAVPPDYRISICRPDDLLLVDIDFYGAELVGQRIVPNSPIVNVPGYMVVNLPPQHILEEVGLETAVDLRRQLTDDPTDLGALWDLGRNRLPVMRAMLSTGSRIAYQLPLNGIDFNLSSLLSLQRLSEQISATRDTLDEAFIEATVTLPDAYQTALEMPTFLTLVPDPGTSDLRHGWQVHSTSNNDRSVLWHIKRTVRNAAGEVDRTRPARLFVAGTPFSSAPGTTLPTATAIQPGDFTNSLVRFNGVDNRYLRGDNVMLSALGGWLKLRDVNDQVTGEKWIHNMTMGRDHFVRIVDEGFLFPFGHRAALVAVSERKFIFQDQGNVADTAQRISSDAMLLKRQFIIVRERERNYVATAAAFTHAGRELPFDRVQIVTEVTPLLDPATIPPKPAGVNPVTLVFWPQTNVAGGRTEKVQFELIGIDKDGRSISFEMPLVFVPDVLPSAGMPEEDLQAIKSAVASRATTLYGDEPNLEVAMKAQQIAYTPIAPSDGFTKSLLMTEHMRFDGQLANSQGGFLPQMREARVTLPELGTVSGRNVAATRTINYASNYLTSGFPTTPNGVNKEEVFALFADGSLLLEMPAERTGFATPSFSFDGLSRVAGPVPFARRSAGVVDKDQDITHARALQSDPPIFNGLLFGGLLLSEIVEPGSTVLTTFNKESYKKTSEALRAAATGSNSALADFLVGDDGIVLDVPGLGEDKPGLALYEARSFALKPKIKTKLPIFGPSSASESKLAMVVTEVSTSDGKPPKILVDGKMTNFFIAFPTILRVDFASFKFSYSEKKGFEPTVEIQDIILLEALEFLNPLRKLLKKLGLGFKIEVGNKGLKISLYYTVPDIQLGALALRSLKPSLGIKIPFDGKKVSLLFGISDRKDPFTISVTVFGGGGFFALEVALDGKVKLLEIALEFGGAFSLNLGVAKGAAYLMAGIYFGIKDDGTEKLLKFEAYVRTGGKLDILAFIVISVELYVGLGYEKRPIARQAIFFGVARITVEISIFFFSFSVGVEYKYEQVSEGADPTFGDILTINTWSEYCDAFALDEVN